ncbi:uncharacterized protein FOBCDRAFT_241732 [Fusarium oxysporum Fo47]|uniref:uncharacterized protein n=1 Tax=Fusarium oxysporum Fo47 TaxID=660027 RepID=UPI0028698562|nr:uncharacterized protein FOBCDRAFT_241732 [Fusarium oxysporum Fo47]WJG35725.1 hypothetical protein FOBCDRAFT_241732 [Fusarium oxysporum Fo47]
MFYSGFSIDRLSELVPLNGNPLAKHRGITGRIILAYQGIFMRIYKQYPKLASMPITDKAIAALIEAAQEVWNDLEAEVLENLINSMPKRLTALHQAKGYYTKY